MKNNYFKKNCLYLFLLFIVGIQNLFAQLSDLHYLPPLKSTISANSIKHQAIYLSTPEATAFDVKVFRGTGTTAIATLNISNAASKKYNLPVGKNNITLVTNANTDLIFSDSGLRFESPGGEKFYVNYRGCSADQAVSLTYKGRKALGKRFKWGGLPNRIAAQEDLNTTLGIMATTDDTEVTISGYSPNFKFRHMSDPAGLTSNDITVNLNVGQSFVLEALKGEAQANRLG